MTMNENINWRAELISDGDFFFLIMRSLVFLLFHVHSKPKKL